MVSYLRSRLPRPQRGRPPWVEWAIYGLVALWLLAMIRVPIQLWMVGEGALPAAISLGVTLQALAVVAILAHACGGRRALAVSAVIVVLGWLVEALGHSTGFPFGSYDYTAVLQPQLLGVPLLIPLAWLMMMPPSWAVAQAITRRMAARWRPVAFVAVSMLAFTAWDLFLDPQMVGWGLWVWNDPGSFTYFGIPWSNYAGWLLASALITWAGSRILPPDRLPVSLLVQVYAFTLALEFVGLLVFWNLPGPALVGGIAMSVMLAWAVWRARASA